VADNAQKTPFGQSLNRWGAGVARSAIDLVGKNLPATIKKIAGAIATVSFQVQGETTPSTVPMPTVQSLYLRIPYQVGDQGMTIAGDLYIGGQTGLGGGVAGTSQRGNLSTLAFVPLGDVSWGAVDPNAVVAQGPNGFVAQDLGRATVLTLTPGGITITSPGTVTLTVADLVVNGISFVNHEHSGVTTGSEPTGPPIP
jgi:hypothetical protein